jgi:hypothetical protein
MDTCSHLVEIFYADERLIEGVADFLAAGFADGSACIAAVTPAHRTRIDAALAARGYDGDELVAAYRYIVMDARATLASFRSDGAFDVAEFHRSVGQLIALAASGGREVRIVGEMVVLLAEAGEGSAVIELEEMWNDLSREHPFTLYCVYPANVFEGPLGPRERQQIRALHSRAFERA